MKIKKSKIICKMPHELNLLDRRMLGKIRQDNVNFKISPTIKELDSIDTYTNKQVRLSLAKLEKSSLIKNISTKPKKFSITKKGIDHLKLLFGNLHSNCLSEKVIYDRAHRITIHIPIIFRPKNIPIKGFKAQKRKKKSLSWNYLPYQMKGDYVTIIINPRIIIFHFKEVYSKDAHHASLMKVSEAETICKELEQYKLEFDYPSSCAVSGEHAIYNQEIANYTKKFKLNYTSSRLTYDHSKRPGEFELTDPINAEDDFLILINWFEGIIREGLNIKDYLEQQKEFQIYQRNRWYM